MLVIRRSITLSIGITLSLGSFLGMLFWGRVVNPPPYRVVISVETIQPFTELRRDMFIIDEQILSPQVAQRYVLENELPHYLDALPVETLYVGEPVSKNRLLDPNNPLARYRLGLALVDASQVAMVVPVTPLTTVSEILPGDLVNIEFSVGSRLSLAPPVPISSGPERAGLPTEEQVILPLAKTLFQRVPVLRVNYEQIPNPSFGLGASLDGPAGVGQSAFIRGPIQSIVVLIPADQQEMLTFALENGTVRIALASPLASQEPLQTLPGVMWPDFIERFLGERGATITRQLDASKGVDVPTSSPDDGGSLPIPEPTPTPNSEER